MKSTSLIKAIAITSVITSLLVTFNAVTVFQQLAYLAGGIFAIIVIGSIGLISGVDRTPAEPKPAAATSTELPTDDLIKAVRKMRDAQINDVTIARMMGVNIYTIEAIK